ncbi:hypothetical protein HanXRQr2_Chr09g0412681 [Helianthus annuus]|uniref:Uncharacterized protein n=1 Tax=Helianthus annuus TaxID=4232 RepID=A0A9K3NAT7_HELAN|nr:hypothetical protein HanXRQr2_Chr09g0412681 [Helianthus annuus]
MLCDKISQSSHKSESNPRGYSHTCPLEQKQSQLQNRPPTISLISIMEEQVEIVDRVGEFSAECHNRQQRQYRQDYLKAGE